MQKIIMCLGSLAITVACAGTAESNLADVMRPQSSAFTETFDAETEMRAWITDFRPRALARGISQTTFDRAFAGVRYNPEVIRRDGNQAEFTKTIWDYLDAAVSDTRIENGRATLAHYSTILNQIEAEYGVDKEILVAFWGIESNYGTHRGDFPVVESLATLAYEGRRASFFEEQLIAALKILQADDVETSEMVGSWAGAMGHTQFMPDTFLSYAIDFSGDGRRDIWSDDPTDALASTSSLLARGGWQRGQVWGLEVSLPRGFDYAQIGRRNQLPASAWAAQGVRSVDGKVFPPGQASILLPGGAEGAAFLVYRNFHAIRRYNPADSYAIAVAHLADRLRGLGPIQRIPANVSRALSHEERLELQERLTRAGFDTRGTDGRIGPNTVKAIRAYQRSVGLIPDGFADERLLRRLR
ncbi:lytic murein transglycosylase [Phyllobacterium phragmitis]|uniref:Lytic murein transglycosylase n=1 Tax=Phyllobacterium phragmitis TaxID=2670329 RepID=A0A2S9IRH9_9HYPH|nr:lytic murein transglycosylase [Phyllobacterium phragmitis]PRD43131.1 lytic murein transglycosylase [Phyllobacterium phragmitis]